MDWFKLVQVALMAALGANKRTAPIANEVAAGVAEAETIFTTPNSGASKLAHVLNIARDAAQATDELRGGTDDVPGQVSVAVGASIAATNAVLQAVKPGLVQTPGV